MKNENNLIKENIFITFKESSLGLFVQWFHTGMFLQGKQQPNFIFFQIGNTNSLLKPPGTTKTKLAKPKVFHLKTQLVEVTKSERVTHMVRHYCIYFSPCSLGFQQQIWADEHQQTWVPTVKERAPWSCFNNCTETLKQIFQTLLAFAIKVGM